MVEEQSGDGPGDSPWITVAAAARALGISPRAIRGRIRRGTIEWKPAGNTGRLVRVPPGKAFPDDPEDGPEDEAEVLREELHEARLALAVAVAERRAADTIRAAEVAALRELADRLTTELADARRPWWRWWR